MTKAIGTGTGASRRGGWFSRFLRDLFSPRSTLRVLPPPPRTWEQAGKEALVRGTVTEFISGPDTTFAEKAMFVASPEIVNYAAYRGARSGLEQRSPLPPPPNGRGGPRGRGDV